MMKNIKLKIFFQFLYVFYIFGFLFFILMSSVQAATLDISVKINGLKPYPGDPISATPRIEVTVTSSNAVDSIGIHLDSISASPEIVGIGNNYFATHEVTSPISDGAHTLTIEAFDTLGNGATYEASPFYVQSEREVAVQGFPLNHPNPFNAGEENTRIGYTLSKPANITLSIFDLTGNLIAKKSYPAGENGGRAGYNEVTWDGKSDSGSYVGNGIYLYLIIADGKVVQNGKGKITVFKQ